MKKTIIYSIFGIFLVFNTWIFFIQPYLQSSRYYEKVFIADKVWFMLASVILSMGILFFLVKPKNAFILSILITICFTLGSLKWHEHLNHSILQSSRLSATGIVIEKKTKSRVAGSGGIKSPQLYIYYQFRVNGKMTNSVMLTNRDFYDSVEVGDTVIVHYSEKKSGDK